MGGKHTCINILTFVSEVKLKSKNTLKLFHIGFMLEKLHPHFCDRKKCRLIAVLKNQRRLKGFTRRHTSSAGSRAFRPGQVVPGKAHLVVAASCALDRHVELIAYSQVLLLKENLQPRTGDGRKRGNIIVSQ